LKEAHKSQDLTAIDAATETLNQAWAGASEEIYNATQEGNAAADGQATTDDSAASDGQDSDVSDVEYEEVDDKK